MNNKILFLCNCLHKGGAQRVLVSLANYMAEHGFNVSIIASFNNGAYPLHESIKVKYVGYGKYLKFIKVARTEIKQEQPKVVISFEYFFNLLASIACLGLKSKLIISERNDPSRVGSGFIKDRIRNFLYRFADVLVCQTPDAKNYFPFYIQKKTVVIANPLKPNLPYKSVVKRKREVVTFCRLNAQKNLPMLITAFFEFSKTHPDFVLKIYGDGEEKTNIENLVKQYDLTSKVSILKPCDNVHELIIDSAMFVLPSDYEGLSNSMLEAIAIGLPSICTDCPCGGARMIIEPEKNGLLIPVGDTNALIMAMNKLAEDESFAEKISNEGLKLREHLSIQTISNKWISLF